jgi:hypothetical protein
MSYERPDRRNLKETLASSSPSFLQWIAIAIAVLFLIFTGGGSILFLADFWMKPTPKSEVSQIINSIILTFAIVGLIAFLIVLPSLFASIWNRLTRAAIAVLLLIVIGGGVILPIAFNWYLASK